MNRKEWLRSKQRRGAKNGEERNEWKEEMKEAEGRKVEIGKRKMKGKDEGHQREK